MAENRMKVLEMLAQGKISVDDAERLLDRLAESPTAAEAQDSAAGPTANASETLPPTERVPPKNPRYLRVIVNSSDGDKVNVRVPMALVRTGVSLAALLPEEARDKLDEKGVKMPDLAGLKADEIAQALAELQVDVDSADGDTVRVYCE